MYVDDRDPSLRPDLEASGAQTQTPAEGPAQTPVEASVTPPSDAQTTAETPVTAQTPVETPAETPAETPVVSQTPVETPVTAQTPTESPVTAQTPTETPAEAPVNAQTPAAAPAANGAPQSGNAAFPGPDREPVRDQAAVPPAEDAPRPAKAKKKRVWLRTTALVLVCALVGGAAGLGGAVLGRLLPWGASQSRETVIYEGSGTPVVVDLASADGSRVLSPAEVYAGNADSVVGVITQVTTNVWGQTVSAAAAGSGFILTQDGYIVTNYHVVEDASSISIQLRNGDTFSARLVGGEAENDVAVLKVDAQGLTPVRLGTSGDLVVGEPVVAIGNPLGEMTFSMTGGMISALDKSLTMRDGSVINVLQTDAAINAGNSGGPLFNMYGQVVGITNAKYSNNGSSQASIEGICFAIPIDDVKDILQDIIQHGYVTGKPYAGFTLSTANAAEAARYGRSGGAYVQSVVPGSAAERAGLRQGDIITAVDGETVEGVSDFTDIRDRHRAGDTVSLTVDREARSITVSLTFDERKPDADDSAAQSATQDNSQNSGGQSGGQSGGGYGYGFNPFSWFGW